MRKSILILVVLLLGAGAIGQTVPGTITGTISFISSTNVYVKFNSTEGLSGGDTLFMISKGVRVPVLIVGSLSSKTCIGVPVSSSRNLAVSTPVIAVRKTQTLLNAGAGVAKTITESSGKKDTTITAKAKAPARKNAQKIRGSLSAYSYSDFSNTLAKNSTRLRYSLSLDARNIGNSKFSIENYISFNHKLGDWAPVKADIFNALKIYSLDIRYDPNSSTQITLGRRINNNVSSIGAMDGLQIDKSFNRFIVGALAGFRPDYRDYGFNSNLLQYGAYIGFNSRPAETFSQTSLAFMEQMNNLKTDRRFLYFQHSNSLLKNVYLFSTFEVDLYKVEKNQPKNTFDLTGLYLSLRYRMTKNLTITGSFDERKNVMYYETYKTLIDSVLINQTRRSIRLQANYRITKNLTFGLSSDYRFLISDPHIAKNINGYLTYYKIPWMDISVTLSATYLESSYMNGKTYAAKISRELFQGKLQTDFGYRREDYLLPENGTNTVQNIGEFGLYWQMAKKISFSVNWEGTFENNNQFNRVFLQLRKRF